jgi:copper chaperone
MSKTEFNVIGLHCGGCAGKVSHEVSKLVGVVDVSVDVASGHLVVSSDRPVERAAVAAAVDQAGYALA